MTRLSMQGTKSNNTASLMVESDIIRMIHAKKNNNKKNNKKNDEAPADRIPSLIVNDDDSTSVIDDDSSNVIDDQNYKNDISEQTLITTATTNEMKKIQLSTKMLKISSSGVRTSLLRKAKVAASSESETRPAEEKKQRSYMRKSTWENAYLSNIIVE